MARLPRYILPGQPQHVIQRGNNRAAMFVAPADYHFFCECLKTACERHACGLHAYVLMTNHVHLLLTPNGRNSIGKVMQSVGRRYVRYFNVAYRRTGTLWEGRYRASPVDTERYLFACYRYIELNPVRAAMVTHPGDHPWSSHRANALRVTDPLVTPHARYQALGADDRSRQAAYRALFRGIVDETTLRDIREASKKGWALGDDRFREEIARLLDRRVQPLPRAGAHLQRSTVSTGSDSIGGV
jgi:putative transposase